MSWSYFFYLKLQESSLIQSLVTILYTPINILRKDFSIQLTISTLGRVPVFLTRDNHSKSCGPVSIIFPVKERKPGNEIDSERSLDPPREVCWHLFTSVWIHFTSRCYGLNQPKHYEVLGPRIAQLPILYQVQDWHNQYTNLVRNDLGTTIQGLNDGLRTRRTKHRTLTTTELPETLL